MLPDSYQSVLKNSNGKNIVTVIKKLEKTIGKTQYQQQTNLSCMEQQKKVSVEILFWEHMVIHVY